MKPYKTKFQVGNNTYECEFRLVKHRDKSETLTCKTTIGNKPVTLKAEIRQEKPKRQPDLWIVTCNGWRTGSTYSERYGNAAYLFRTNIEMIESFIEASKYEQVTISVPKGEDCYGCPVFNDYEQRCQYLDIETRGKKDKECPAKPKV